MTRDFKSLILDLASDDYTGLWELVWRANTIEPPQDQQDVIEDFRTALIDLIRDGKVAMYRGTAFNGDERRVSSEEVARELRTETNWQPPTGALHVRVVTE